MNYRSTTAVALLFFACASVHSRAHAKEITQFTGRTMGTTFSVRAVLPVDVDATLVGEQITDRLDAVNQAMSTYITDSELSRFNRMTTTNEWFDVSKATAKVVSYSLKLASDSDGAFDPTVGPVVDLWGFGPDKRKSQLPTDEEIAAAMESIGYANVEVREDPPAIKKLVGTTQLNLSAVAKGYGVDAVGEELEAAGCAAYMVEIGGEVLTRGKKPSGAAWQIGIEQADEDSLHRIIALSDEAMATSGDYRNFFEHEGKRYSHTIDPTTGRPVEHSLATVTVRTTNCMEADALATAILVMGPERGYKWAEEQGVAALLVERQGDQFHERMTPVWEQSTKESKPSNSIGQWQTFVIAGIVFGIAIAGMAIGVIVSNRRLQGSCGGLAGRQDEAGNTACALCQNPSPECTGNPDQTT